MALPAGLPTSQRRLMRRWKAYCLYSFWIFSAACTAPNAGSTRSERDAQAFPQGHVEAALRVEAERAQGGRASCRAAREAALFRFHLKMRYAVMTVLTALSSAVRTLALERETTTASACAASAGLAPPEPRGARLGPQVREGAADVARSPRRKNDEVGRSACAAG